MDGAFGRRSVELRGDGRGALLPENELAGDGSELSESE